MQIQQFPHVPWDSSQQARALTATCDVMQVIVSGKSDCMHPNCPKFLEAGMEKRRDWTRGAASGGGRRRGRGDDGAACRSEALAVDIKERDREAERKAICER